jgi:DeoR family glycerol-3-phosphate regulon repressor
LRVITNSTVAAGLLARNPQIAIHVTGGFWQANNHALGGSIAAEIAGRYRCDLLFTSIGAIDADGWLLEFREEEVVVAKTMLANARRRILLADHSKFTRVASCKLARIGEMTTLITDAPPPPKLRQSIQDSGCELIIAAEG